MAPVGVNSGTTMMRVIVLAAVVATGAMVLAHCGGSETPGAAITGLAPAADEAIVVVLAEETVETDDTIEQLVSRMTGTAAAGKR